MTTQRLRTRQGGSQSGDEAQAVAELHAQIAQDDASVIIVFCSSAYDLPKLGHALRSTFSAPILACTSSGQIGARGFQLDGFEQGRQRDGVIGRAIARCEGSFVPRDIAPGAVFESNAPIHTNRRKTNRAV